MKTSDQMRRVSGTVSLNIGDIKVSFVPDGAIKIRARGLFPGSNEGDWVQRGPPPAWAVCRGEPAACEIT
jgi:hypothetical protein